MWKEHLELAGLSPHASPLSSPAGGGLHRSISPSGSFFSPPFKWIGEQVSAEKAAWCRCCGIYQGINTLLSLVSTQQEDTDTFDSCSLWTDVLENQWCEHISSTSANIHLKSPLEMWKPRVLRSVRPRGCSHLRGLKCCKITNICIKLQPTLTKGGCERA